MEYTNIYRYIVIHEIQKPKNNNNAMKDFIGGGNTNNKGENDKNNAINAQRQITSQQSTMPEADDFYSNDPKIVRYKYFQCINIDIIVRLR